MFRKNRKHPNVGRIFYSPFFKRNIEVIAYNSDTRWWFCFEGTRDTAEYIEHKAQTKLSAFEKAKLERGGNE